MIMMALALNRIKSVDHDAELAAYFYILVAKKKRREEQRKSAFWTALLMVSSVIEDPSAECQVIAPYHTYAS